MGKNKTKKGVCRRTECQEYVGNLEDDVQLAALAMLKAGDSPEKIREYLRNAAGPVAAANQAAAAVQKEAALAAVCEKALAIVMDALPKFNSSASLSCI